MKPSWLSQRRASNKRGYCLPSFSIAYAAENGGLPRAAGNADFNQRFPSFLLDFSTFGQR